MNKAEMRDILEKHAEDYIDSLKRSHFSIKQIEQVRETLNDFFASKQVELYNDLIKSQHFKM